MGNHNFAAARSDLELIHTLSQHLLDLPLELLPDSVGNAFLASLKQAKTVIDGINSFSLESGTPPNQLRDQYLSWAKSYGEHLLTTTQSWIPFLAYRKGDVQKNIEALSAAVKEAHGIRDRAAIAAAESVAELGRIVAAAREASAEAGVGVFTAGFTSKGNDLDGTANQWLIATGVLAGITIAGALIIAREFNLDANATNATLVQYVSSKAIALVMLFTATVWCGRIYKATKHQAAANTHRGLALKTFQAFIAASKDDATRNAVLLETTRSIFAIGPSGYLDSQDSTNDSSIKVLELFKQPTKS